MFNPPNYLGICGWKGLAPLNAVAFRTLCLVLGEPRSTRTNGTNAVLYRWRCGCSATSEDGYKCKNLSWCEKHRDLLWLPAGEADNTMEAL